MCCLYALLKVVFFLGLDEYILPKIAERNLRRFANLRSTSSDLEVHLPISEVFCTGLFVALHILVLFMLED